ncbi:MAG: hypothetical protein HOQ18_00640 [Dermatophilaceae bacterium]|nr:hypothetical protein [Dermatophilaceae bacterium]NUR80176.1 hypothetical protein [Dermatophilaceae bacterium]
MSVNLGERVDVKIRSNATAYAVEIYRLGWYRGLGARHVASARLSAPLPQTQPACTFQPTFQPETDLVDCGTWRVSASW